MIHKSEFTSSVRVHLLDLIIWRLVTSRRETVYSNLINVPIK